MNEMCFINGKCGKMEEASPDNIVLVSTGTFFDKAAKEAVIKQNGCLVVPQLDKGGDKNV